MDLGEAPSQLDRPASRLGGRNQQAYDRAKAALEAPMMLLSLALGVLLVAPLLWEVSSATEANFEAIGWVIWALFVVEYGLLLWLAPDKKKMMRGHVLELFLILVPMLRPLRALRVLRMARAVVGVVSALAMVRRVLVRRGLHWFLVSVFGVVLAGAGLTFAFERTSPDSSITSFGDALWWAVVTCTTVGYGDMAPVTPGGRGVAIVLMIVGVGLLSTLTANIASFFVEQDSSEVADAGATGAENSGDNTGQPTPRPELETQVAMLNAKVDQLLAELAMGRETASERGLRPALGARPARQFVADAGDGGRHVGAQHLLSTGDEERLSIGVLCNEAGQA
jgi:voltage-gated potassium channel